MLAVLLVVVGLAGLFSYAAWSAWRAVERVEIERPDFIGAAAEPADPTGPDATAIPEFRLPPVPSATDDIDTFLFVGTDSRAGIDPSEGFGDFGGERADVIVLLIRPRHSDRVALLSLPRDLWVSTPCGQERINAALAGCQGMSGEATLLVTVESITGLGVDHFGMVDMANFRQIVDELGGYRICVERPVRDRKAGLQLDAGCHLADGATTLAWMRSRSTLELNDRGYWVRMPGVSDLTRNERQREFLIEMMRRMSNFADPQDAVRTAQAIAPHVTIDSKLGITQAVSLAWTLRGLDSSVTEIVVPVESYVTSQGAWVLRPTADIAALVQHALDGDAVSEAHSGASRG
jgi:LCP family protein required for cell wall assembly